MNHRNRVIEVRRVDSETAAREALKSARRTWPACPWQIRPEGGASNAWVLEYVEGQRRPVHPRQVDQFRERTDAARLI